MTVRHECVNLMQWRRSTELHTVVGACTRLRVCWVLGAQKAAHRMATAQMVILNRVWGAPVSDTASEEVQQEAVQSKTCRLLFPDPVAVAFRKLGDSRLWYILFWVATLVPYSDFAEAHQDPNSSCETQNAPLLTGKEMQRQPHEDKNTWIPLHTYWQF